MWWCACKAATHRGALSGYSWPHVGPVVEGRCFSQVSNWRDVARHNGFHGPCLYYSPTYLYTHLPNHMGLSIWGGGGGTGFHTSFS